jgi:hypothetical protein
MDNVLFAVLVVIAIVLLWHFLFRFGPLNTKPVGACTGLGKDQNCEYYYVHREHNDAAAAAALMNEITSRNDKLINHIKNKYDITNASNDPDKSSRIDVVPGTAMYSLSDDINWEQLQNSHTAGVEIREYLQERIHQLIQNYDQNRLYEISPLNKTGVTSYAEDKTKLILCLRKKTPNDRGEYELHDINTMMFVVLHELAHMMNNRWGHDKESRFWTLFKFLLANAVEINVYTPVHYGNHPITYCGLRLTYNPYFDSRL